MKLIINILFIVLCVYGNVFGQSLMQTFEKAKEIKLLESKRADVYKILANYEHDKSDDEYHTQDFSDKNTKIDITFSDEECSDNNLSWNVSEWTVTKIKITPEETVKINDVKFDFSHFKKEIEDEESPEEYSYHDEKSGIVFVIDEGEIEKIFFYPPNNKAGFLCSNETASEVFSGERRISDIMLDESCHLINHHADVTELKLSANEIIKCGNAEKNKKCANSNPKISVATTAVDLDNDVLTYNYVVSAGKIIGQGKDVFWDLSGAKAGTYTILAGVDDGCGICGATVTETVVVKECNDCSEK